MGMDEWDHLERVEREGKSQDCRQPSTGGRERVASEVRRSLKAAWSCRGRLQQKQWVASCAGWSAVKAPCRLSDSATPWAAVSQASLSVEFSRQEYWSGLPSPSPGDLPDQGSSAILPHCRQTLHRLSHQGSPGLNERWAEMRVGTCLQGLITLDRRGLKVNGRDFTSWRSSLGCGPS